MMYLCDIYTDEDEYEVYLEKLLMRKGEYLFVLKNGQPQVYISSLPKRWVPSKANIMKACGIETKEYSFSWKG